jgi:hypothetical protein
MRATKKLNRVMKIAAIAGALSFSLMACSSPGTGGASSTSAVPAPVPSASSSPLAQSSTVSATPSVQSTPTTSVLLADTWKDRVGYAYRLEITGIDTNVTSDTLKAKPGKVDVRPSYLVSGRLSNLTLNRIAPIPVDVGVAPIWLSDSPACSGSFTDKGFWTNAPGLEEKFCKITGGIVSLDTKVKEIPTGGSVEFTAHVGQKISYDESTLPEVQQSLRAPAMWTIGRDEGESPFAGCLLQSGIVLSAATGDTGCPPN